MAAPNKLRIPLETEEYARFDCVGRLDDGRQFLAFVTGAFPGDERYPSTDGDWQERKQWVAVIHLFDDDGNHLSTKSRLGGREAEGWEFACAKAEAYLDDMLAEMNFESATLGEINVKLFSVNVEGVRYGLIYERDNEDYETEWVMLIPNDIMFHPPWDSGEYST